MKHLLLLIVLTALAISLSCLSMFTPENYAYAIVFLNYTSEKYGIHFEYPSDWDVLEKQSRFDEGGDIAVKSGINSFIISRYDDLYSGFGSSDIEIATNRMLNDFSRAMFGYDVRTIEEPTYLTIDGHKAGTFLVTFKEKFSGYGVKGAIQQWIIFVGNIGYLIMFSSSANIFDSPENIDIRDHFINSIKYIGDKTPTTTIAIQLQDLIKRG
jgi:hypothetical protein